MQYFTPMQMFIWIVGIVAASMLVIGLFSEWIFRIYFNCKKRYIADMATALSKTIDVVSKKLQEKADLRKEEQADKINKILEEMMQAVEKSKDEVSSEE